LILDFGADQEFARLVGLPVVFEKALGAGAFAAETFDFHVFVLVKDFDALLGRDGLGVVAFGRIPDRKDDDLLAPGFLLDAEIAVVESADHEIAAGDGLLNGQLIVKGVGGGGGGIGQVYRASGARRRGIGGEGDSCVADPGGGPEKDDNNRYSHRRSNVTGL